MTSDPFLRDPSKRRKRSYKNSENKTKARDDKDDEEIDSDEFDSDNENQKKRNKLEENNEEDIDSDTEFKEESKTERRRRLAKQYLENIHEESKLPTNNQESNYGDDFDTKNLIAYNTFDAKDLDDDIIARRLQLDVSQQKGNIYKFISSKLNFSKKKIINTITNSYLLNPTCLTVNYPHLYIVSKNRQLIKYDISNLTTSPKKIKYVNMKNKTDENGEPLYHTDDINCVAVSPSGKFVVTGGKDRNLLIWDTTNLTLLKKIELGHKNAIINAICFRNNTNELYVATNDLKIRVYNINQFALIDTLYGHQDSIIDISALNQERCVTVGLRDRSAMYWKIAEQTRLTFNSSISFEKFYNQFLKENKDKALNNNETKESMRRNYIQEGSLECVSMLDHKFFVTGSDNGNISFWTIHKKKPISTIFQGHGLVPNLTLEEYTGDQDYINEVNETDDKSKFLPPNQAYWITAIYGIPFTNIFITGSWNGQLKVWKVDENFKKIEFLYNLNNAKGIVTSIEAIEVDKYENKSTGKTEKIICIFASLSKEHKQLRSIKKPKGANNSIYQAFIKLKD